MQPIWSVAKPPVSVQVGYYNINKTDEQLCGENHKWHVEQLGRDCVEAMKLNHLGMLCLCGVGSNRLDKSLDAHLGNSTGFRDKYGQQDVSRWLKEIIQECCKTSMNLEAHVLGPYAILLDTNICCFHTSPSLTEPLVTYDDDHSYRRAVHSVIQVQSHGAPIEVWVHHAESCPGRGYSAFAREQTMEYFFRNMSGSGIVGGDLNMSKIGVRQALDTWSSRTTRTKEDREQRYKAWQIHSLLEAQHGDLALSRGLTATQISETLVGGKEHELVVVQINLEDLPEQKRPTLEPSSDARESSVAEPAPAARCLNEDSRALKFLTAIDEAAHASSSKGHPAQAELLRELLRDLVKSLWWGDIMRVPTGDVRYLDEEKHHEFAIAKLDQVIDLVAEIRMAWINSPESVGQFDHVAGRRLGQLTGDLTENEISKCHNHWMNSLVWMTDEKRRQYKYLKQQQEEIDKKKGKAKGKGKGKLHAKGKGKGKGKEKREPGPGQQAQQLKKKSFNVYCFQASGSKQFLMALVRQPSFLNAENLEKLLHDWREIKQSDEYKTAVEQSNKRTHEQTMQKTELQNLRMKISRLRRQGTDTQEFDELLEAKQKKYGRSKQHRPPGAYLASNTIFSEHLA